MKSQLEHKRLLVKTCTTCIRKQTDLINSLNSHTKKLSFNLKLQIETLMDHSKTKFLKLLSKYKKWPKSTLAINLMR